MPKKVNIPEDLSADRSLALAQNILMARQRESLANDLELRARVKGQQISVDEDDSPLGIQGSLDNDEQDDPFGNITADPEGDMLSDKSIIGADPRYVEESELPTPRGDFSVIHETTGERVRGIRLNEEGHVPVDDDLSVVEKVRRAFSMGLTREQLKYLGFNGNTVNQVAAKMQRESGHPVGKPEKKEKAPPTAITKKAETNLIKTRPGGKPSQPEDLINSVHIPFVMKGEALTALEHFEQGMKFGMSVTVMGVRLAQELSAVGISQAKPLLEMAKSMREGEAIAAKNASMEAALATGKLVMDEVNPTMRELAGAVEDLESKVKSDGKGGDFNPMQHMMMQTMQPLMQKIMSSFSGLLGGSLPGPTPLLNAAPESAAPDGWTIRQED